MSGKKPVGILKPIARANDLLATTPLPTESTPTAEAVRDTQIPADQPVDTPRVVKAPPTRVQHVNVDVRLHRIAKIYCAEYDLNIRDFVEEAITAHLTAKGYAHKLEEAGLTQ